ncbi:hypothetical protein CFP65_2037 [Kitasatospora sp. MMS16-BH015]|uniref:hypothetical protein n=1 Tax=Kitasatospora sp. MMS16-BH015 TaxID=2018025 RepID=UPI000CA0B299|nr:hypothetical protein [Kitasatospora sp. MMS16-BH015]AUG76897.1 hypothetical protein CFP65_2037 [Kitasatospora sp. MMS16-BH015]
MRTPPMDSQARPTLKGMEAVTGDALDLLRRLEQQQPDPTGQRARWIEVLGDFHDAPGATPSPESIAEVLEFLELLELSLLARDVEEENEEEEEEDQPPAGDGPPAPPPTGPVAPSNDDGLRERIRATLDALETSSPFAPLPEPPDLLSGTSELAGLMEIRRQLEQAQSAVREAQEEVNKRELVTLQTSYSRDSMHAVVRQIELEEKRLALEMHRLDLAEREAERRHRLDLRRLDLEADAQRSELARYARVGEHERRREQLQQRRAAGQQITVRFVAGAAALTVAAWPGLRVADTSLAFLTVAAALFLLTALAIVRGGADQRNRLGGLPGAKVGRAMALLPVAGVLVTASALASFASVLLPGTRREQLGDYAHRTLGTAERLLLGP